MRLALAMTVALVHAEAIGWDDQPEVGNTQLGELAVDGFFVLSGFLVTRSATRLSSLRRFVWHRALRILPGFWVCLALVAFVAAPLLAWLQGRSAAAVVTAPDSSIGYLGRNALLLIRQWDIAGLTARGSEGAMNGSLWTLFYEALCYLAVGLLVGAGVVRRRCGLPVPAVAALWHREADRAGTLGRVARRSSRHLLLLLTIAVWLVHTGHTTTTIELGSDYLARFLLLFLLGALGHVYAHRIRFTRNLLAWAVTLLAMSVAVFVDYRPVGAAAFAYLMLWATVALPVRWEPPVDLSYGLYVYHWPVELVLAQAGVTALGQAPFTILSVAVAAGLAYASWRWVEAPALRQKDAHWVEWRFAFGR